MAIGEIRLFAGNYAPAGWRFCDGSSLKVADHRKLFDRIGNKYGGDGSATFALPDLRGRTPMHRADGAALGTKATISVEKARPKTPHARLALNFIIDVESDENPWPDPFLGEIRTFGCNFAPEGWHRCEGELAAIESNTALFSILGNTYGGDGSRTFALPDLREAYPVAAARPDQRAEKGGARPDSEEASPQGRLLTLTYCIAMKGMYPPR